MKRTILEILIAGVFLLSAHCCVAANLVVNSGFETTETTGWGWVGIPGNWAGDYSLIVGASSGIDPLEGSQMLKFIASGWESTAHSSAMACQVYQVIDVSSFSDIISAGGAIVSASSYFNRIAGDAQTDTEFITKMASFEGDPSSFPAQLASSSWLARTDAIIYGDDDPLTWEYCQVQQPLPPNTDFIAVGLIAVENVHNDLSAPEFDGHFADVVSVEIIPEPATLGILGLGGLALLRKRTRV